MQGDPTIGKPARGVIKGNGDGSAKRPDLPRFETLQIIEQDAGMLLAVRDAKRNPARKSGAVF